MGRSVVTDLLFEEIQRTVGDAIDTDGVIWASTSARQLKETYLGCALTEREIEDVVVGFAVHARVPVEFGHTPRRSAREPAPGEILTDIGNTSGKAAGRCAS